MKEDVFDMGEKLKAQTYHTAIRLVGSKGTYHQRNVQVGVDPCTLVLTLSPRNRRQSLEFSVCLSLFVCMCVCVRACVFTGSHYEDAKSSVVIYK